VLRSNTLRRAQLEMLHAGVRQPNTQGKYGTAMSLPVEAPIENAFVIPRLPYTTG
jgi:hypothetical protein